MTERKNGSLANNASLIPAASQRPRGGEEASITARQINALREETGASMSACKAMLVKAHGDMALAAEGLRRRGQAVHLRDRVPQWYDQGGPPLPRPAPPVAATTAVEGKARRGCLVSLSDEELAKAKPPTAEQIHAAVEKGRQRRAAFGGKPYFPSPMPTAATTAVERVLACNALATDARQHFLCDDCGAHVRGDEDCCCVSCGADLYVEDCACASLPPPSSSETELLQRALGRAVGQAEKAETALAEMTRERDGWIEKYARLLTTSAHVEASS